MKRALHWLDNHLIRTAIVLVAIIIALSHVFGCAGVKVELPNNLTAEYWRVGDQSISFSMERDENGIAKIDFNQDAQAAALTELVKLVGTLSDRVPIYDDDRIATEYRRPWTRREYRPIMYERTNQ